VPPVFVTGHSRSGTSLTAGLLASQGVWFGPCHGPAEINKKGFFESNFVKDCIKSGDWFDFHRRWELWRAKNDAGEVWGVKCGPRYFGHFEAYSPVIVCTHRQESAIRDSRKRAGFKNADAAIRNVNYWLSLLPKRRFIVYPDKFSEGDFSSLRPVLDEVGLIFNQESAEAWVDPGMWNKIS